jgi:hypothetical protein
VALRLRRRRHRLTTFLHRDDETLPFADRFTPDRGSDGGRPPGAALVPFSAGECAGRNLVLLVASTMLAALLEGHGYGLDPPGRLDAGSPLPGTLDPFGLRFVAQRHCCRGDGGACGPGRLSAGVLGAAPPGRSPPPPS